MEAHLNGYGNGFDNENGDAEEDDFLASPSASTDAVARDWKQLQLSLERPYKDDNRERIPVLEDITPQGQFIYEPKEDPSHTLGERLRRIFVERGVDFFDRTHGQTLSSAAFASSLPNPNANASTSTTTTTKRPEAGDDNDEDMSTSDDEAEDSQAKKVDADAEKLRYMTPEELFQMRMEILPQLFIALGEMSHARDLLATLLSTQPNSNPLDQLQSSHGLQSLQPKGQPNTPSAPTAASQPLLSATLITKPPPITSVRAFNAQLILGSKDEALRTAASVFKNAAESMERGRLRTEQYWVDALKIRRENWGLVPAPLPLPWMMGAGKGADRTAKDFWVSFGLEESPAAFRRMAIGHFASSSSVSSLSRPASPTPNSSVPASSTPPPHLTLTFPNQRNIQLRISLLTTVTAADGNPATTSTRLVHNTPHLRIPPNRTTTTTTTPTSISTVSLKLRAAQLEVVETEIFSILVQEAGKLPSSAARVSERLIVIDAAEDTELRCEFVDSDSLTTSGDSNSDPAKGDPTCDLIYHLLHVLLLRRHSILKATRLSGSGIYKPPPSTVQSTGATTTTASAGGAPPGASSSSAPPGSGPNTGANAASSSNTPGGGGGGTNSQTAPTTNTNTNTNNTNTTGASTTTTSPPLLQPLLDILQYQTFLHKIRTQLGLTTRALLAAQVPATLRFDAICESGAEIAAMLSAGPNSEDAAAAAAATTALPGGSGDAFAVHNQSPLRLSGEALLRIGANHTLRFSFSAPTSLLVHLAQGTLSIISIPQLVQLLNEEVERCLLNKIKELGRAVFGQQSGRGGDATISGSWFVDSSKCIGRWDGGVLVFQILHNHDRSLDCSVLRLDKTTTKKGDIQLYSLRPNALQPLLFWAEDIIKSTAAQIEA